MKFGHILRLIPFVVVLAACGGGGSGGGGPESVTGQFIDDPVQGLNYSCSSGPSGITNNQGEYTCNANDTVTFSVGSLVIGQVVAQETAVTPYSLFPDNVDAAINVARLLQTLDGDGDPSNGVIQINEALANLLPANTSFESADFSDEVETALGVSLTSYDDAINQLNSTITNYTGNLLPDGNQAPVADAGPDQDVSTGVVTLNGSASSDADNDQLSYGWVFLSKPDGSLAVLSNNGVSGPTFTADIAGPYVLSLFVFDGHQAASDQVTINVTGAALSGNADLSALTLSSGTLIPAFSANQLSYSATVDFAIANISVTPTTSDNAATVSVNGASVVSGTASNDIPLGVGTNTIEIMVTAENSVTQPYSVVVTRNAATSYSISGEVVNLVGTLGLQLNANSPISVTSNGTQTFFAGLPDGFVYSISVSSQPTGQSCIVTNASGTVATANVTDVSINCSGNSYTLGGTVSGLTGSLEIDLNGSNNLTLNGDGSFTFPIAVEYGTVYQVNVVSTPAGYTCQVSNGSGTMPDNALSNIAITCSADSIPPGAPTPVYPSTEPRSNWINYNPTWEWVSGGGGNGTYRYVAPFCNPSTVDMATSGILIQGTQVTLSPALTDGNYSMCVQERDDAGNWSDIGMVFYSIETVTPGIVSVSPADGASGIILQPVIEIIFDETVPWNPDEEMNLVTMQDSVGTVISGRTVNFVPGVVGQSGFRFTPNTTAGGNLYGSLVENETYTVTVTDLFVDNYGNSVVPYSWQITTRASLGYYPGAANWNDYVINDGGDVFSASGVACDATLPGLYNRCIHGGEMRVFNIPGQTDCTGLTAVDELAAFNWTCLDNTGDVRFVSTGLQDDVLLLSLINGFGWNENALIVSDNGSEIYRSISERWWTNPVDQVFPNSGFTYLTEQGKVYWVSSSTQPSALIIQADKISVVGLKSNDYQGVGNGGAVLSSGNDFLWIEGTFLGTGDIAGLSLGSNYSMLRHLDIKGSGGMTLGAGLQLTGHGNLLQSVNLVLNNFGLWLNGADYNTILDTNVVMNSYQGIRLDNASSNVFNNLMINNNATGLEARNSNDNIFDGIATTHNAFYGLSLNTGSFDNTFTNITTNNNKLSGVTIEASSDNNLFLNLASIDNGLHGLNIDSSNGNTFQNLAITNNGPSSLQIGTPQPVYGLRLSLADVHFTGQLVMGSNGDTTDDDCVVSSSTGIDTNCIAADGSDHVLTGPVSVSASFIGRVTSDSLNASDTSGSAIFPTLLNLMDFDWLTFEQPFRAWGGYLDAQRDVSGILFFGYSNVGKMGCNTHIFGVYTSTGCDSWGDPWHNQGAIWDWNLDINDSLLRNVLTIQFLGNSANSLTHTWSDNSTTTFLRNAVEISGNRDGLCNTGETCLTTPNIGRYQGHGNQQSAGTFVNGDTLSNIQLQENVLNGY